MKVQDEKKILLTSRLLHIWKAKPSRREGYYRCYFMDTPQGDHIEVDHNHLRQMVQITVSLSSEQGREYTAVIKSGTIIRERDLISGRALDLTSRIRPFHPYFGYLREEAVLRAIGGNYAIPAEPYRLRAVSLPRIQVELPRRLNLLERLQRYLRYRRNQEVKPRSPVASLVRRAPAEIFDLGLGGFVILAYLNQWINITQLAGVAGFLGIATGILDWIWRQRSPFLPKVLILFGISFLAAYEQIQYRIWGIFL